MTDEVQFECVVSADLFARAQIGVATGPARYYLNGVHVSPGPDGGAVITATDGSMLISMFDPDAYVSGEAIVQLDKPMLRALSVNGVLLGHRLLLVKMLKGGRCKAFVVDQPRGDPTDESFSPHLTAREVFDDPDQRVVSAQFSACIIDGKFPNWRAVMPSDLKPDAPTPMFDHKLMARIVKALGAKHETRMVLTPSGENPDNAPILVTPYDTHARQAFAILMPMRNEPRKSVVPAWTQPPAAQKAA